MMLAYNVNRKQVIPAHDTIHAMHFTLSIQHVGTVRECWFANLAEPPKSC